MKRWHAAPLLLLLITGSTLALSLELRCSICGNLIPAQDKHYKVEGGLAVFCERCYAQAPRCSQCKLPTALSAIDPDTGACPQCLAKLPRCKVCGKPMAGIAYAVPTSRGIFCSECKNNRPACYACGAPAGDDYWSYPDGRIICGECGERAIFDIESIHRIMREAREIIERRMGLTVKNPYVVTVEKLSGLSPTGTERRYRNSPGQSPLYGNELGMFRGSADRSEIFLLFGLPPEMLYEAAAHEYAHAWQAESCPAGLTPELREGFAQWVAADVLRAKGFKGALEKLELRRDSPYGTGYQRLRSLGQRKVLEVLRRENQP